LYIYIDTSAGNLSVERQETMKAIFLAAGFCTRFYPVTQYFPKGLLPIGDKPIVQYMLDDVWTLPDIDSVAIVTNHRYQSILSTWIHMTYPNRPILCVDNGVHQSDKRRGAIGDLLFILSKTKWNDDILVISNDILTSMKLTFMISFYHKHHGIVNSLYDTLDTNVIANKLGCAILDGVSIKSFVEKPAHPTTTITSIPCYIFPKESLPLIRKYKKEGNPVDAPGSIIPWMIGKLPVFGYDIGKGYYYDVGTIEAYTDLVTYFSA